MAEVRQATQVDITDVIDNQKVSSFQVIIVITACTVMFFEGYDMQVVAYAAPSIIQQWGVSKALFAPVFSFGLFGYLIGATTISNMADQFGRKKIIVGGLFLFGALTLLGGFATSVMHLIVLRLIAGIGLGASIPTTIALAAEYVPARIRATIITVLFLGYTTGGTVAGLIAAKLIPSFNWPIVFYIGGIAPMLLGVLILLLMPESVRFLAVRQDRSDKVLAVLRRLRPNQKFESDAQIVIREEKKKSGLPVKHLFTDGRATMTVLLWCAFVFSLLGHHLLAAWLPTALVDTGVSLGVAATAGGLLHTGGGIGGVILGRLLDKKGIMTLVLAYVVAAPFTILIAKAGGSTALLLTIVFLAGFTLIGGHVGLTAFSGSFYPTFIRSTGTGWSFGVGRIGSMIGPLLGGFLMTMNLPIVWVLAAAAVPGLICAVATYFLGRTMRTRPAESS